MFSDAWRWAPVYPENGVVDPAEPGVAVALPDPALIVLVGASGAGKSVWAAEHYRPDEVVSSDRLRVLVGSGEHDLDASADAFALLDQIVAARLRRGLSTACASRRFTRPGGVRITGDARCLAKTASER
jgi:AAA domain